MINKITTQEVKTVFSQFVVDINQGMASNLMRLVEDSWMQAAISYQLGWLDNTFQPLSMGKNTAGGKKLRPMLAILCYQSTQTTLDHQNVQRVMPFAAALELIHNYSLVHDDIEDEDRSRRGRETLWAMFGKPIAINVGDCIHALAFYALNGLRDYGFSAEQVLTLWTKLASTSVHLTLGQHSDLSFQDRTDVTVEMYLKMIEGKTASLIGCAAYGGALLGLNPSAPDTAQRLEAYNEFGKGLGMSFQIKDDVLGIWGSEAETGKPTGSDIRRRKKSLPVLYGLQHSPKRETLIELYSAADPLTPEQELFITSALEDCGARQYAEQKAEAYKTLTLEALTQALGSPNIAGMQLQKLTEFMIRRSY